MFFTQFSIQSSSKPPFWTEQDLFTAMVTPKLGDRAPHVIVLPDLGSVAPCVAPTLPIRGSVHGVCLVVVTDTSVASPD